MKLSWEGWTNLEVYEATTPFGSYKVSLESGGYWSWGYCFEEYYDEDWVSCESKEEGMRLANEDWQNRIAPILEPYLNKETGD